MHVEKPSATSAAITTFCAAQLHFSGRSLWFDGNGKITAGNGTLDAPKPNAFSLVHIDDCPGSTPTCRASCYVHGLQKHAPDTFDLYRHNSRTIREILAEPESCEWANVFAEWITANAPGGFRWHVSGDVFSLAYALWIADVCRSSPKVRHWIYTRSLEFVPALATVSTERGGNLALNISCDADNYRHARKVAGLHDLRLCYLTSDGNVPDDLCDGDVIFPDYRLRGGTPEGVAWFDALHPTYKSYVCPVDFHGKSERRRCGPCNRCMK